MGDGIVDRIIPRIFLILFFIWLVGLPRAWAVPGKEYTDMTVSNENQETITGYVLYSTSGGVSTYAAISLKDSTPYTPHQTFYNYGDILLSETPSAHVSFLGMGSPNLNVRFENRGEIRMAFSSPASSMTLEAGRNFADIQNYGDVYLSATGGTRTSGGSGDVNVDVVGFRAFFSDMENHGNLVLEGSGGTTHVGGDMDSTVVGLISYGGDLTNSGNISVTTRSGVRTGSGDQEAYASGITTLGDLVNTGRIEVTAHGGKTRANTSSPYTSTDIRAFGIVTSGNISLHSQGLITVSATPYPGLTGGTVSAYQVSVNSGTATITGYAMALKDQADFTQTYDGCIRLGSGANAVFNNARLYLTLGENFSGSAQYEIPMLAEGASPADQFTTLAPLPAEYSAQLISGNGTGLQKIQFEFAPQGSAPLVSARVGATFQGQGQAMMEGHMVNSLLFNAQPSDPVTPSPLQAPTRLLAGLNPGAGPLHRLPEAGNYLFGGPLYLKARDDSPTGYEAENQGLILGYTHQWAPGIFLGPHAGTSRLDIDYTGTGMDQRSEDVDTYFLGGHGLWQPVGDWVVMGMLSLYYGEGDYRDLAPTNVESGEYDAWTLRGEAGVGRRMIRGNHTFFPKLGMSWAHARRSAFTTDNRVNPDVTYGAMEENEVCAKAGVQWMGRWDLPWGMEFRTGAGLGVTQILSDGKYVNTMSVGELSRQLEEKADKTRLDPRASLTLFWGNLEWRLAYSGSHSRNNRTHLVWSQMGISF